MSAFRRSRTQSAHDLSAAAPRRRLRRPQGGLWDHPDFMKLWAGQTISEFGTPVSQIAIPWIAIKNLNVSALCSRKPDDGAVLVSRDQLVEGNSKLQVTVSGAQGAGPAIGGGLIQPPLPAMEESRA